MNNRTRELGARALAVMTIAVLLLAAMPVASASAAIGPAQTWSSVYEGINHPGPLAYTVNAGSLRMLVVGVTTITADSVTQTVAATYGGVSMTLAVGDGATASYYHTYLLYLKDTPTVMNGTPRNIVVTITGGTPKYNFVYAAVYNGVEQTGSIRDTKTVQSSGQNVGPFSTGLTINTGDQAVEMIGIRHTNGDAIRTISTWAAGWSAGFLPNGFSDNLGTKAAAYNAYAAVRTIPTGSVTDTSLHLTDAGNLTDSSMSGMSLKSSPLIQTATSVATSGSPQTYGSLVTFTATVDNLAATGSVDFYADGTLLGSGTLSTVAGQRKASYTTTAVQLNATTHSVIAAYNGDSTYAGSVSVPVSQETTRKWINVVCDLNQWKLISTADPVAFTYTYDPLVPGDSFTGALARDAGETEGTYTIRVGTLQLSDNYTLAYQSAVFTIVGSLPTPVTVTANSGQTKVYGAADPTFTYTSSEPSAVFTGALSRATGENVGNYGITQGTLSASGYVITFVPADFAITVKTINVSADAKSKLFGAADPTLTYTSDALSFSDTFTGALSRQPGEAHGMYDILQGTLGLSSNYSLSFTSAQLTIYSQYPTAGKYDDPHDGWTYAGTWYPYTVAGPYLGTVHLSSVTGATASFTFDGNRFVLSYVRFPNFGNIGVYLDGSSTPLTTLTGHGTPAALDYTSPYLWPGPHTIVVKHEGPAGKWVAVDAIEVSVPTYQPAGTYDDGAAPWIWAGNWTAYTAPSLYGLYNDTLHVATTAGSTGMFSFVGSGFELTYLRYTNLGTLGVYLDGNNTPVATFNTNGSPTLMYYSPSLTAGPHTVVIKNEGPLPGWIAFDKVVVTP